MNRLFIEFFKEFPGVILEVCETILVSFWRCFGRILKEKHQNNHPPNGKFWKNNNFQLFPYLAPNSLFIHRVGCSRSMAFESEQEGGVIDATWGLGRLKISTYLSYL